MSRQFPSQCCKLFLLPHLLPPLQLLHPEITHPVAARLKFKGRENSAFVAHSSHVRGLVLTAAFSSFGLG